MSRTKSCGAAISTPGIFLEITGQRGTSATTNLAHFVEHLPELIDLWTFEAPFRSDAVVVKRAVRVAELRSSNRCGRAQQRSRGALWHER